ncbi:hypothetical protein tb265_04720 [Gemmatimonadetes bacterium T265]|nr:hypothetical protein tb265_04720 [Gemmatimonadetes bacterium T265]
MDVARRLARLGETLGAPRRRAAALLAVLGVAAGAAWSAAPACACGGGWAPDIYQPYLDLGALIDNTVGQDDGAAYAGDDVFRFNFLAPALLADSADPARRDEYDDLLRVYTERSGWAGGVDLDDSTPPRLTTDALTAALRAGALDRAAATARALVERSLDMPAGRAQLEQPVVQRAVEYLELRPELAASDGPLLARFFAAPPGPRDTPHVSLQYDSISASRAVVRAWRRAQTARVPNPVPTDSLPAALGEAAALRRMSRADLAAAAERLTNSPRLPSLRFVALQERTRALVGNGWDEPDTTVAGRAARRALRRDYAAWLAAYPTHPLAELVRLTSVRADRLAGDSAAAWATLLAEYPRHRGRVLTEMYYLLDTGFAPNAAVLARITDPLLRSAFVFHTFDCDADACRTGAFPRARWDAEWRAAQDARPAAWAVNAQERLLRVALGDTTSGALPAAFPAAPEAPTPLWGALRLALLIRAERWADADAQAAVLTPSPAVAAMRMRLALRRGQWSRAFSEPQLDPDARRYFLHIMAPDSVLAAVSAAADTGASHEALRARAARRAAAGDWAGAARIAAAADTALARRLGATGPLAADRSGAGRAAYARHLVEEQDSLLGGADEREWYRTVEARWLRLTGDTSVWRGAAPAAIPGVPWTPAEEQRAARRFLLTNSELFFALGAYADALRAAPPRRLALAREADVPYNRLINRNYDYTVFWRRELARDPDVAIIRNAGRR